MTDKTEVEVEKTKAEVLDTLETKIRGTEEALAKTRKEHDTLQEGVAARTRTDALGGQPYPQAGRREDQKLSRDLAQEVKDLQATLLTLQGSLSVAKHAAALEQLEAVGRGLKALDTDLLAPALAAFRTVWNQMLGAMAEVNKCFEDRGILEGEWGRIRETLPKEDQAAAIPPAPPFSRAGFRNLLVWRGVDPPRFFKGLDRFQIQESDVRGADRAAVLTVTPDAAAAQDAPAAAPETEN